MLAAAPTPPASQKYAVAGTLKGILSMAGKMMGEDGAEHPTGDLTDEQIKKVAHEAVKSGALSWTGFEEDERGFYTVPSLSPFHYQFARSIARAAIAAHLARQAQAEPIGKLTTAAGYYKMFGESDRIYSLPIGEYALYLAPVAHAGAQNAEAIGNQWISVDDCLPEPETDVLIIRLGQIRIGAIFIEHESWEEGGRKIHYWDDSNDDGQGWDWCEVTHWMPLPEAPALQTGSANTQEGGAE
jgi:hypothetical protein